MNGFCCATSSRIQCCKRIIRNWKKLNGGTHHANPDDNYCNAGRYWRNRSRQRGSSRSVVRRVLPLPSTSLLRLLPVSSLQSLLAPLAPLVLALAGGSNSKAVGGRQPTALPCPLYVPCSRHRAGCRTGRCFVSIASVPDSGDDPVRPGQHSVCA